jgi:hypothetical protein
MRRICLLILGLGVALGLAMSPALSGPATGAHGSDLRGPPPLTTPILSPTFTPSLLPAPPDISGRWSVVRTWWDQCPGCSFPVQRTTQWEITQSGDTFQVDRGLRGTIDGYRLTLSGIESDGFKRRDFYYDHLILSPDLMTIHGSFSGSETIHNLCDTWPPQVTCFALAGVIHMIRQSPPPTATPTATATSTATATPTATGTNTPTPSATPTATPTSTSTPTASPTSILRPRFQLYLPLLPNRP